MTQLAFDILGPQRPGRWLVTCDHASNAVPAWVGGGTLGLDAADMARHIAWDPGAAGLSVALAERLHSPAILSTFSRLVIDPNRGEDDPTLIMQLYDGTVIPGNRHLTAVDRQMRLDLLYRPYHATLGQLAAAKNDRAMCAVHSFTPQLKGRPPRPWAVGILHSPVDSRLARAVIARLRAIGGFEVGDNQPYSGHLPGDAIDRHALRPGRPNVLIELRQDLISHRAAQEEWADLLAPVLQSALMDADL